MVKEPTQELFKRRLAAIVADANEADINRNFGRSKKKDLGNPTEEYRPFPALWVGLPFSSGNLARASSQNPVTVTGTELFAVVPLPSAPEPLPPSIEPSGRSSMRMPKSNYSSLSPRRR